MKRTFLALMMALTLTAVSCEQVEELIIPVFPESQEMIFTESNSVKEFTFEANSDWTLESNVAWCQFLDANGEEHNSIQGQAGNCTVQIKVTAKGQLVGDENTKDETSIVMIMKDQKKVVIKVSRQANPFVLNLLDEKGNPISTEEALIEVGYKEFLPFTVKANFPFYVKSQPKWIEFEEGSMVGAVNQVVTAKVRLISDGQIEKYPIEASEKDVITFSDREGKAVFNVKVKYAGMPAGMIEIESAGPRTDWTVSMDGLTYTQEGSSQNSEEGDKTFQEELTATVKTLNDKFDLFFIEESSNMYFSNLDGDMEHPVDWMNVTNDKGNLTISVGPAEADRHGWILALPEGSGITAENWFEKFLSMEMDPEMGTANQVLNLEALRPYLVAELLQAEPKAEDETSSMIVTDMMQKELPLEKLTGEWVSSEYGVDEVYVLKMTSAPLSVTIDPMIEGEYDCSVWLGDTDKSDILDFSSGLPNVWLEEMLVPGQSLAIIFKQNMVNVKVLLIEPAE